MKFEHPSKIMGAHAAFIQDKADLLASLMMTIDSGNGSCEIETTAAWLARMLAHVAEAGWRFDRSPAAARVIRQFVP